MRAGDDFVKLVFFENGKPQTSDSKEGFRSKIRGAFACDLLKYSLPTALPQPLGFRC